MEFKYTEDQIALRRAVREWAQSYLAPKAEEIDVNNRFPTETIKALGEQDLMGLAYPEELGGAGYDAISEAIAMEEISAACASTGSIITGHYLGFDALYLAGTPEQKEKWLRPALEGEKYAAFCLTEPAGGSDMTSNKTTAVEDGDYYVINGVKHFITGGAHCDFLCCFAITNKEDPKHGMTCFVVEKDTPGMKIASEDNKMGIRGARTAEIVFEDCRVPKENMVGELNGGYRLALDVVDRGRIGIAAMAAVLKDAIKPNLVQTLEGTPAFIHGGPFANIAHGCNSIQATETALKLGEYTVTEAGFAADLGAEKFLDIKCRAGGFHPDAVVIVATVRALKYHGGVAKADLNHENLEALEKGLPNLLQHVDNVTNVYGLPCVVAINAFPTDTEAELKMVEEKCREKGVNVRLSEVWAKGGEGGKTLAEEVIRLCEEEKSDRFQFVYDLDTTIEEKLNAIATKVYRADGVVITAAAKKQIQQLTELGFDKMPICMAKTQFSFSDDASKLGAPRGFKITVREVKVNAGAGFLVAKTGDIMTMPGLPKVPSAEKIDIDDNGVISGLF